MGRYRPPTPKGSPYITPEGEQALRQELQHLWQIERPKVTDAVHEAAKNGDRSENGDYIYGKQRLREIDRRVRFLSKRLEDLQVVDAIPEDKNRVYFGAYVTIEALDSDAAEATWRIVGPDEYDLQAKKLSMDSPLAKALLGKRLDDDISIEIDGQAMQFVISDIAYDAPKPDKK